MKLIGFSIVILTLFSVCEFCESIESTKSPSKPTVSTTNKSLATCPPPEDPSIFDVPDKHIGNLVAKYHRTIEYYCDFCPKCIREKRDQYMHHFDMWYPRPCWGYEYSNCLLNQHYLPMPVCQSEPGEKKKNGQKVARFYRQGDFSYIKYVLDEMKFLCWPDPRGGINAWLQCTRHLQYCSGSMVRIDFRALPDRNVPVRYHMDVLKIGDISAHCKVDRTFLERDSDFMSPLQSWAPEMRNLVGLNEDPFGSCDVVVERPTFIMKLDSVNNMYHHFCDFLNLYASQHVNNSDYNAFSTDVNILIWEGYTYRSPFEAAFEAFTRHPILTLNDFSGKTVCFRNVVFPLLPRMVFGLYYNTPLEPGCSKSALFDAFSEHMLHRLRIPLHKPPTPRKLRVTILDRLVVTRRILNAVELTENANKVLLYNVQLVTFETMPFKQQLEIIRNTDILVGMHGAGLTHVLFLPRWATVFELYNCGDPNCYKDLARLRGVDYLTWKHMNLMTKHDDGKSPPLDDKFCNYSFDVTEFLKLLEGAAIKVLHNRSHHEFSSQTGDYNPKSPQELYIERLRGERQKEAEENLAKDEYAQEVIREEL